MLIDNIAPFSQAFSTLNAPLDHWAKVAPNGLWLAERSGEGWRSLSFGEGLDATAALACGLAGLGLGPGKPLMILARNGIDHALISFAAMRIGAPIAPISVQYAATGADPARLAHAVALIGPACIFVDDAAMFVAALDWTFLQGFPVIAGANAAPNHHPLAALLSEGRSYSDQAEPDGVAKLLLTSGSTGRPKAVACTHRNIAFNAGQIAACYDDPDPPVLVNSAPWSHSLGGNAILQATLHRGGALYIDAGQPVPGDLEKQSATCGRFGRVITTWCRLVGAFWLVS